MVDSELLKIFESFVPKHNVHTLFDDLLSITLTQFMLPNVQEGQVMHSNAIKHFDKKEHVKINEFIFKLVKVYERGIDENGWCDPWGDLYMDITSKYKAQGMGQFFTPEHLCSLVTAVNGVDAGPNLKVSDPACGSGRMLLAFHANNPGNFMFAEDLDPVCIKMCVTNFAFHGCIGEVVQHNTLSDPKGLINGWKVENIGLPIPAVLPLKKEHSFICSGIDIYKQRYKPKQLELNLDQEQPKQLFLYGIL